MALRAASEATASVVAWSGSVLYFTAAQAVAFVSTLEIGPNLLAAITSIIGAGVLLGQIYLAQRIRKVDELERHVKSNTREAVRARSDAGDAQERVAELERKTNGE